MLDDYSDNEHEEAHDFSEGMDAPRTPDALQEAMEVAEEGTKEAKVDHKALANQIGDDGKLLTDRANFEQYISVRLQNDPDADVVAIARYMVENESFDITEVRTNHGRIYAEWLAQQVVTGVGSNDEGGSTEGNAGTGNAVKLDRQLGEEQHQQQEPEIQSLLEQLSRGMAKSELSGYTEKQVEERGLAKEDRQEQEVKVQHRVEHHQEHEIQKQRERDTDRDAAEIGSLSPRAVPISQEFRERKAKEQEEIPPGYYDKRPTDKKND